MEYKNYKVAVLDQNEYSFDLYVNNDRKKWFDIVNDKSLWGIVNLGYFNMSTFAIDCNTKIGGTWVEGPHYQDFGISITKNKRMFIECNSMNTKLMTPTDDFYHFQTGCPPMVINTVDQDRGYYGRNGNVMIGMTNDDKVVIMMCEKDEGQTSTEAVNILVNEYGCIDVLRYDGSWSVNGRLGPGEVIQPSEMRIDKVYLLIYKKDFTPLRTTRRVVIDPFGDTNSEAVWSFCEKLKEIFISQGIEATLSHYRGSTRIGDTLRAKISNQWNADYLISVHESDLGEYDIQLTTSSANDSATRNILAKHIMNHMSEKGKICSSQKYSKLTILTKTSAPANLITLNNNLELDTNEYERDLMVYAVVESYLEYLKLDWVGERIPKEVDEFNSLKDQNIIPEYATKNSTITWGEIAPILAKLMK